MFTLLGVAVAVLALAVTYIPYVLAGPPLICAPFDIGDAKSLPWGGGRDWNSPKADYPVANLVKDTLALLSPDAPVIVRMETIRRAVIYSEKDPQVASELLSRVMARALDAGAAGKPDALAWFDAGYVVETFKQARWMFQKQGGRTVAEGISGYDWAVKGLNTVGNNPAMEFAAALILTDGRQKTKEFQEHLHKATAGAPEGSLLGKNIASHFGHLGMKTPPAAKTAKTN